MSFEEDYDKGIERFLDRFWDKKQRAGRMERIRREHRKSDSLRSEFEELRGGEAFRQTADVPVVKRCQVLVVSDVDQVRFS